MSKLTTERKGIDRTGCGQKGGLERERVLRIAGNGIFITQAAGDMGRGGTRTGRI